MADAEKSETQIVTEKAKPETKPTQPQDKQSGDCEGDKSSSPNSGAKKKKSKRKKKKRQNAQDGKQPTSESESQSESESKDINKKEKAESKSKDNAVELKKGNAAVAAQNDEQEKHIEEESEDEGIEDLGNPEDLDGAGRNTMFERAKQYESKGKRKCALKCYLQCLTGLKDTTGFSFLPQCLRSVADLYFEREEFEKAIQFIQAEKMFYETALIDTSQLQTKLELAQQGKELEDGSAAAAEGDAVDPEALRADEYEKLARLCLEKHQPKLALEYQGKATKLRQKLYGDADTRTIASLDFFTVVYAEVGKQQYEESLEKLDTEPDPETTPPSPPESPTSILRKRKKNKDESGEGEKKQVRFENPPVTAEQTFLPANSDHHQQRAAHEDWVAHTIVLVLFVACAVCLAGIGVSLYCQVFTSGGVRQRATTPWCTTARTQLRYVANVAGYYWQRYVVNNGGR